MGRGYGIMTAGKRPILVTGATRSGTTWIGRMVAASPRVGYIPEPLNFNWGRRLHPGMCTAPVRHWFPYICEENADVFYEPIRDTLRFRYSVIDGLRSIRSLEDVRRVAWGYLAFWRYRSHDLRPLVKDPHAVASAEWLAEAFGMDVVVMIRHPAAFASSIKRLNWTFPFSHFLGQPLLMRAHLGPFKSQLDSYAAAPPDIIDQAILLWNIIYYIVSEYRNRYEDWVFLRHEDVARAPLACFQRVYEALGLRFSEHVRSVIREHTASSNPARVPVEQAFSTRRNSRSTIWRWKERLTDHEIARVKEGTWEIAGQFYSAEDW
jgi:hypothetical protein